MMSRFLLCAASTEHSSKLPHVTSHAVSLGNEMINELHDFILTKTTQACCFDHSQHARQRWRKKKRKRCETKVVIGFGSLIDNSYASVTVNTPTG